MLPSLKNLLYVFSHIPFVFAFGAYEPKEGDLYFQSLPRNAVVNAIEGLGVSLFALRNSRSKG